MLSVLQPVPFRTRWTQLFLGTTLLFLSGSFFSISVFNDAVEKASVVPGALDDVWSSAMAMMSLFAIPFTVVAGCVVNAGLVSSTETTLLFGKSKTDRLRIITFLSALSISTLFLSGVGTENAWPNWVTFAVVAQGVPFNIYFILVTEFLAAWTPRRPGLAVGCGLMSLGFGAMFFLFFFELLIDILGCVRAIYVSATILSFLCATMSVFLQWPPASVSDSTEFTDEPSAHSQRSVSWITLPLLPSFWLYVFAVVTSQIGFVFIPNFLKMGQSFGRPTHALVNLFEVTFLVSTLLRPFMGLLADSLKYGCGCFSVASKNTMSLLLIWQTGLFIVLIPISLGGYFTGFVLSTSLLVIIFFSAEGVSSTLARDIFGSQNSTLVFGAGGIIAFGLGEYLPSIIMTSIVDNINGERASPSKYTEFYMICACWSAAGLLSSLVLQRCPEAFQNHGIPCRIEPLPTARPGRGVKHEPGKSKVNNSAYGATGNRFLR